MKVLSLFIGACLLLAFLPLLFANKELSPNEVTFFIVLLISFTLVYLLKKQSLLINQPGKLIIGFISAILFSISNEISLFNRFELEFSCYMPISLSFLSLGFFLFLFKTGLRRTIVLQHHPFVNMFILSVFFLTGSLFLFQTILSGIYPVDYRSLREFGVHLSQMIFVVFLVWDFLDSEMKAKIFTITLGGILCLSSIIYFII